MSFCIGVGLLSLQVILSSALRLSTTVYEPDDTVQIMYVNAHGRSMSSTMQGFLRTFQPNDAFTLFEPCHGRDATQYGQMFPSENSQGSREAAEEAAAKCTTDVLSCDFSKFDKPLYIQAFSAGVTLKELTDNCEASSTRNIKTTTVHNLTNVIKMLETQPEMKVVHMLRDPRSIYASQKGALELDLRPSVEHLCKWAAYNLDVTHPKIHKVQFHDVVTDAKSTFKKLTEDLGLTFAQDQERFVKDNFNNANCKEDKYSSCKVDSKASVRKWEQNLDQKEKDAFHQNKDCMKVIRAYYGDDHESFLARFPALPSQ